MFPLLERLQHGSHRERRVARLLAETFVTVTLLLLLVLALRRPVARAFGAGWAYALWTVPALRLVLPPLPQFAPDIQLPSVVASIPSAALGGTAPLPVELAVRAEARLGAPLLEIYGCTETGQIASRRTAKTAQWELFPLVTLTPHDERMWACGGHVEQVVRAYRCRRPQPGQCRASF